MSVLWLHVDPLGPEAEGVREVQEEVAVGRRVRRRRRREEDAILAYVQILEEKLDRLREEVSRARGRG